MTSQSQFKGAEEPAPSPAEREMRERMQRRLERERARHQHAEQANLAMQKQVDALRAEHTALQSEVNQLEGTR